MSLKSEKVMSIDFLKTKVDQIKLSLSIPETTPPEEYNGKGDSENIQPRLDCVPELNLPIDSPGTKRSHHRSQTMKHYTRAKSDSVFKHQNTLQVISTSQAPPAPTSPTDGSDCASLGCKAQLIKAKSEGHFQPQSFLQIQKQIQAVISTPSSPNPLSPSLRSIKDTKSSLGSNSFCDIFSSIANIQTQVIDIPKFC